MSRTLNLFMAIILLIILFPFLLLIGLLVKITSKGPIIFKQERIGKHGQKFILYKFRTMYIHEENGFICTAQSDKTITSIGKFLRRTRLDELPQLFNIVKGEMNFVGVRPDIESHLVHYTAGQKEEYMKNLPGIYGLATYVYRYEARLIDKKDKEKFYLEYLLPRKCALNKIYNDNRSLTVDIRIILANLNILPDLLIAGKIYKPILEIA